MDRNYQEIKVELCHKDAKLPKVAKDLDAGADLFVTECGRILPGQTVKLPSGVKIQLQPGTMALNMPRSSMAIAGIISQVPPIDAGFRGEINAIVTNTTDKIYVYQKGERLCQIVIIPIIEPTYVLGKLDMDTERGDAMNGSSGK